MSAIHKILGQAAPELDTLTVLYTVPAGKSTVVSRLLVTHIGGEDSPTAVYRVSLAVNGEGDAPKQIVVNDAQLDRNTKPDPDLQGATLAAGDEVRVRNRDAACSFNLFGEEADL